MVVVGKGENIVEQHKEDSLRIWVRIAIWC